MLRISLTELRLPSLGVVRPTREQSNDRFSLQLPEHSPCFGFTRRSGQGGQCMVNTWRLALYQSGEVNRSHTHAKHLKPGVLGKQGLQQGLGYL